MKLRAVEAGNWTERLHVAALRPTIWKERAAWLLVIVTVGIAALSYRAEAQSRLDTLIDSNVRLIDAQQEVIKMQREAVQAASRSVEVAAQGRLDCAQSLEVVTQRQQWLNQGLGLSSRLKEAK